MVKDNIIPLIGKLVAALLDGMIENLIHTAMLVRVLMTAARFWSAPCRGSYKRDTTRRNIKNVSTERLPCMSRTAPTSATVAIPSFSTNDAETTKAARPNSLRMERCSTARIFFSRPFKYACSALFAFKSRTVSIHSCIPSCAGHLHIHSFLIQIFLNLSGKSNNCKGNRQNPIRQPMPFSSP